MGLWSGFDVLVDLRLRGFQASELFAIGALKWRRLKRSIKIAHASFDPRLSMGHRL